MFARVFMMYPFVCDVAVYRLAQVVVDVKLWLAQDARYAKVWRRDGSPYMGRKRAVTGDVNQVENKECFLLL